MKAVVFNPDKVKPVYENWPKPSIGAQEVIIRVHAGALNHRDINITNPNIKSKFVYGSDGAGVVEQAGASVSEWVPGDEVIINPMISCLQCSFCLAGEHSLCEHDSILGGFSWNGTFAEFVKVPARNLVKKPAHLDFHQAATLPLALGTAWRALMTKARMKPGETLLIQGIGGGVAAFALQIASTMGVRVIVTSHCQEKIDRALRMGAYAGINYKEEDVASQVMELTNGSGADVVISSSGKSLPSAISSATKGGRIVQFAYIGETLPVFDVDTVMFKQLSLHGSAMHSYAEFDEAMRFVNQTQMVPEVSEIIPIETIDTAFQALKSSTQFGKIVLSI